MKIRTTKYVFKEGILNTYKNKLMSLASISIVTAALLIFGIFMLITINLNYNIEQIKERPEMIVYCNYELDDAQIKDIEGSIKTNSNIKNYKFITKQEAYKRAEELLGEDKDILKEFEADFLPVSFEVNLKQWADSPTVINELQRINGVTKVKYLKREVEFFTSAAYWVRIVSAALIAILLAISILIIANTIKLTVFSRRREVNIMKYIGATDWFIRLPFVVEGAIIGFAGALIGFVLISYVYSMALSKFAFNMDAIKFVEISDVWLEIIGSYAAVGIVVGALGSFVSIRKYLRV